MKIQYDNTTKRILNVGQQPWANEADYPDSTIIEVDVAPPDPYYDYLYDDGVEEDQYIRDEWQEHPSRVLATLDKTADTQIDLLVQEYKDLGLFSKTVAEIFVAMRNNIDAWNVPQAVKDDLRVWLPLMGASIVWITRRLLRKQ